MFKLLVLLFVIKLYARSNVFKIAIIFIIIIIFIAIIIVVSTYLHTYLNIKSHCHQTFSS